MAKFHDMLTPELQKFIQDQSMFFVATAPVEGRVNLSPKGLDTFRLLEDQTVAYLDLTGAGSETSAHIRENGRITVMFCSFGIKPQILRLYGRGETVNRQHKNWERLCNLFPDLPGSRMIILVHVDLIQTSCGFGVPLCKDIEPRKTLSTWAASVGDDNFCTYWKKKNAISIDGLETGIVAHPSKRTSSM